MKRQGNRRRIFSMRWIVAGSAASLMIAAVVGVGALTESHMRRALSHQLEAGLLLEARNLSLLSSRALLNDYPELILHPHVKALLDRRPELAYVVVVDREDLVQGHADAHQLGQPFRLSGNFEAPDSPHRLADGESLMETGETLMASVKVLHVDGRELGTTYVGLHQSYIESLLAGPRQQLIQLTLAVLAAAVMLSLLLMSQLLRPLQPLRQGLERIGSGELGTRIELKDRTELGALAETINQMAAHLKSAQDELVENERMTHELDLARKIQNSLLPSEGTRIDDFQVMGAHESAAEVGGDFYDVFRLPRNKIGIVIADVCGKGLGGCLVTTMLAVLLRALRTTSDSPKSVLAALDRHLCESLQPGVFVTVFYGIVDPVRGYMSFASAGHSPLMVYRAHNGALEEIRSQGIPLGAVRDGTTLARTLEDGVVKIDSGDLIVQYTDGFYEAFEKNTGEEYGLERFQDAVRRFAPKGTTGLIQGLQQELLDWQGDNSALADDQTLLIVGREARVATSSSAPAPARPAPAAPAPTKAADDDAIIHLERRLDADSHICLPASLDELHELRDWIGTCPGLCGLSERHRLLVEHCLYELCANIIEHGYGDDEAKSINLWWVRQDDPGTESLFGFSNETSNLPPEPGTGFFVACEGGKEFDLTQVPIPEPMEMVRLRDGRGLGLKMINATMSEVMYHPHTPAGHITILCFDPRLHKTEEGVLQ